jgi:hypothetical protein
VIATVARTPGPTPGWAWRICTVEREFVSGLAMYFLTQNLMRQGWSQMTFESADAAIDFLSRQFGTVAVSR